MKPSLLKVLAQSLVRIGIASEEMKIEQQRCREKGKKVNKILKFNFTNSYNVELWIRGTPEYIDPRDVQYRIKNSLNRVLISNMVA